MQPAAPTGCHRSWPQPATPAASRGCTAGRGYGQPMPITASSPPGSCLQSHEILLNKGMKYWRSAINAPGSRSFRATVHIVAAVIGGMRWGKERKVQTQFSTKLLYSVFKLDPGTRVNRFWVSVYFLFLLFEISSPMWPNTGFGCRLCLTLHITLLRAVALVRMHPKTWNGVSMATLLL